MIGNACISDLSVIFIAVISRLWDLVLRASQVLEIDQSQDLVGASGHAETQCANAALRSTVGHFGLLTDKRVTQLLAKAALGMLDGILSVTVPGMVRSESGETDANCGETFQCRRR